MWLSTFLWTFKAYYKKNYLISNDVRLLGYFGGITLILIFEIEKVSRFSISLLAQSSTSSPYCSSLSSEDLPYFLIVFGGCSAEDCKDGSHLH